MFRKFIEGITFGIVLCTLIAAGLVLFGLLVCLWPGC